MESSTARKQSILFELFKNLINIITYIFMVVPAISIVFSILMIYSRKFDETYLEEREQLRFAIFISAILSVALVLFPGLSHLFFFLPANWGGLDESGEWVSMSDSIAGLLSIYSTYLVGIMYDNYLKTIRINRKSEKNK